MRLAAQIGDDPDRGGQLLDGRSDLGKVVRLLLHARGDAGLVFVQGFGRCVELFGTGADDGHRVDELALHPTHRFDHAAGHSPRQRLR